VKREYLDAGEGRVLEVVTVGNPSGRAFVFHHGGLGCSQGMAPLFRAASDLGVFLIGITRGGYAGSSRRQGRRTFNYVNETRVALDHFGVNEFVSFGWSSGGPAMVSDLQDERCVGGIGIASDAPRVSEDWESYLEKYPPANADGNSAEGFEWDLEAAHSLHGEDLEEYFDLLLCPRDREMVRGEFADELAEGIRIGMAPGLEGLLDDFESDADSWGIDLGSLKKPVALFQGSDDRFCTPAHGYYLNDNLGNSELILIEGQGHLSLMYDHADDMVTKALSYFNK
jgi:pimeloyl-ACP methyl ester carboxylesterase